MDITILGACGSMGRRYQAVLKYLGHKPICLDKATHYLGDMENALAKSSHIIVATPTETHIHELMRIHNLNPTARILCEKPVTKQINMLELLKDMDVTVQLQYSELIDGGEGYSYFNYYNHGRDGLIWDCFQIIALSNGDCDLYEDSPIWECAINGKQLSIKDMDGAYISYTDKWIKGMRTFYKDIVLMHNKVKLYEYEHNQSINRNSGSLD